MKYQCLIVDDEPSAHEVIKSHISHTDQLEWAGSRYNGKEALDFIRERDVDVIFLDINMPLLNGLEFLQVLNKKPSVIITSAYSDYGFEAYQNDVIDYLLKPISYPRFLKSVQKVLELRRDFFLENAKLEMSIDGLPSQVPIPRINHIQAFGNYVKVFTQLSKSPILVAKTIKHFEMNLPGSLFVRIHKSYLVNIAEIKRLDQGQLTLDGNVVLPIGRKYAILIEKAMREYSLRHQ